MTFVMNDVPDELTMVRVMIPSYPPGEVKLAKGESKELKLYDWGQEADTLKLVRK